MILAGVFSEDIACEFVRRAQFHWRMLAKENSTLAKGIEAGGLAVTPLPLSTSSGSLFHPAGPSEVPMRC